MFTRFTNVIFFLFVFFTKINPEGASIHRINKLSTLIFLITMEVGINMEGCKSCKINWPFSSNVWDRVKFYSSKWQWEKSSSGSLRMLESFVMKSKNVKGGFFLWRLEFFKIGKRDFKLITEMRVLWTIVRAPKDFDIPHLTMFK